MFILDNEISKKWKSLRTIYTRERGKIKEKSGDGVEDVYVPKWIFFDKLHFLDDFITPRQTISNIQLVSACRCCMIMCIANQYYI